MPYPLSLTSDRTRCAARPALRLTWLALCVCLFALCAPLTWAQTAPTLDVGSKIHVTVAGEADVSGDFTVDTSGDISLLYINQVHVAGLTTAQAADKLASKDELGKYYRNPQVVVTLLSAGGITVEVTGAVTTQGARLVRSDTHLNDVMQLAEPALDADLTKVQITHGIPGATHTNETVDYLSFLNSQTAAGNPALHDGDVIFVPRKENVQILVTVRGEVAKPGRISVASKATAYDAIQAAGGLLADADHKGIVLQHANTTDQSPIDYDTAIQQQDNAQANPVLLDGDIVIVKAAVTANVYTITGAVRQPGEYSLTTPNVTLADAIGKAGGLSDRPKMKELTIIRTPPGGRAQTIKLNASDTQVQGNTLVLPGDNINIPQGSPASHIDPLSVIGTVISLILIFHH
jgi:protein involved in polysaccharide export with SLBB domain